MGGPVSLVFGEKLVAESGAGGVEDHGDVIGVQLLDQFAAACSRTGKEPWSAGRPDCSDRAMGAKNARKTKPMASTRKSFLARG